MAINFNANPYYDDYDQTKGYHRILFKPGVAVQARELTQLQTILNNQVKQFGDHVFIDGSLVIPGQAALDVNYYSVKVDENTTLVSELIGEIVVGGTTGVKAKVINATAEDEDGNPATLFIKYLNSGTDGATKVFANSETITVDGGTAYVTAITPVLPETKAAYTGTAYTITSGVMYVKGNFVYFPQQTYILSKYGRTQNAIVGFDVEESIKSYDDDNTLLDPAQGSYNYSAPGADRYFIGLTLAQRELTPQTSDDENFVELIRIQGYKVIAKKPPAQYNFLADEFARRTYDESGDYMVRDYGLSLVEHSSFYNNVTFNSGPYAGTTGDSSKLIAKITPGKAYVKGYEVDSIAQMVVPFDKARDTESINAGAVYTAFGNYVFVDNIDNIPTNLDTDLPLLNLKDSTGGSGNTIGTARLRFIEYSSGTIGSNAVYKAYLFDIAMNRGKVFTSVQSLSDGTFSADTVLESGSAVIKEQNKKSYIFPMPRSYIESITDDETTFDAYKTFQETGSVGGAITITAPTDTTFFGQSDSNFLIINSTDGIHHLASSCTFTTNGQDLTITNAAFAGDEIIVIAKLSKSNSASNSKAKTLQSNSTITHTTQAACQATTISLAKADIYRLVSVKMTTAASFGSSYDSSSEIDITNRYRLINGQTATHYGLGSIRLKKGKAKPTAPIRITFDYFTHGAGDYFSVESYPSSIDYKDIPKVKFDGVDYALSDCLDFRPRINDAGTGFSGTGASLNSVVDPSGSLNLDYAFYLAKITKIVLDKRGNVFAIDGESSLEPKEPATPDDAMALYILTQDPYVLNRIRNIRIKKVDNRRYTMRDIGKLENRIKNIEYYVSLNLLELDAQQYQIQDASGNDLYKNGFVVDSFTGHGVGDVYTSDYACAIDQKNRILRPQSDAKFYELLEVNTTDNQRASDGYKLAGELIVLDYATEEAFISNPKYSETLTLNPYQMVTYAGIITGKNSDSWIAYAEGPDVYENDDGDYDSLLEEAEVLNKNGTIWGNWSRSEEYDAQGRLIRAWDSRTGTSYRVNSEITTETIKEEISSVIAKMRNVSIDFSVEGLKSNTQMYVFFDGTNVTRDCKIVDPTISGNVEDATELMAYPGQNIITDSDGNISIVFKYSAKKYGFNTGNHILRVSDSETGNLIEETTGASMIYSAQGEKITRRNKIVSTRESQLVADTHDDSRNKTTYVYADSSANRNDIVPEGESTETLLDGGLVKITTTKPDGSTQITIIDPIVISGNGKVNIEPIVNTSDPDYPVDHSGFVESSFMFAAGRYPDSAEKERAEAMASDAGLTDSTVTNASFTDDGSNGHTYFPNGTGGAIDVLDSSNNIVYPDPSQYNDEAEKLAYYVKDVALTTYYEDVAAGKTDSNDTSSVAYVMKSLGCTPQKAAKIIALQTVMGVTNASSRDDSVGWKEAAVAAGTKL